MCPRCVHCFVSLLLQKLANFPLTWFLTSPSIRYPYCLGFFHSPFHSSLHRPQGPQVKRLKFEIISIYRSIYLSLSLFHLITQSIYLSMYLFMYRSMYLSIYLSVCLSVYLSSHLSHLPSWPLSLSISLFHLITYLSIYLPVYRSLPFICLSV